MVLNRSKFCFEVCIMKYLLFNNFHFMIIYINFSKIDLVNILIRAEQFSFQLLNHTRNI